MQLKISTQQLLRAVLMAFVAAALSVTTVFLAPIPLLLLRRNEGRLPMCIAGLLGALLLVPLGSPAILITYLAAVVLAVVLSECENANIGYSASVLVTVLAICGTGFVLIIIGKHAVGFHAVEFFKQQLEASLAQMKLPPDVGFDKDRVLAQVPSAIVMMVIFSVWLNSVMVRRAERLLAWQPRFQTHYFVRPDFLNWKLPDAFVWLALAITAGNFLVEQPNWARVLASNAFNVVVMLYFFQGLAVVVSYFNAKKVTAFWRIVAYLLIFTQLFLAVAILGFVDLWMGFRNRKKIDKSPVI